MYYKSQMFTTRFMSSTTCSVLLNSPCALKQVVASAETESSEDKSLPILPETTGATILPSVSTSPVCRKFNNRLSLTPFLSRKALEAADSVSSWHISIKSLEPILSKLPVPSTGKAVKDLCQKVCFDLICLCMS